MLKKNIKYTDYNGVERKEDHYFNLTNAELTEMEMGVNGGFSEMVERIIESQNSAEIIKVFKDMILKAYGVKSLDGKYFLKEDPKDGHKFADEFKQTEAYSVLYMELATNTEAAIDFINGIMPADVDKKALKEATDKAKEQAGIPVTE